MKSRVGHEECANIVARAARCVPARPAPPAVGLARAAGSALVRWEVLKDLVCPPRLHRLIKLPRHRRQCRKQPFQESNRHVWVLEAAASTLLHFAAHPPSLLGDAVVPIYEDIVRPIMC